MISKEVECVLTTNACQIVDGSKGSTWLHVAIHIGISAAPRAPAAAALLLRKQ